MKTFFLDIYNYVIGNIRNENNIYMIPERSEGCIKENKMISKEKQILLESFDRRNINRYNTKKLEEIQEWLDN